MLNFSLLQMALQCLIFGVFPVISIGSIPRGEIVESHVFEACGSYCWGLVSNVKMDLSYRFQSCKISELKGSVETTDKISPWFCGSGGL